MVSQKAKCAKKHAKLFSKPESRDFSSFPQKKTPEILEHLSLASALTIAA